MSVNNYKKCAELFNRITVFKSVLYDDVKLGREKNIGNRKCKNILLINFYF